MIACLNRFLFLWALSMGGIAAYRWDTHSALYRGDLFAAIIIALVAVALHVARNYEA